MSLIIGKNNCTKTSFLSLLERFLIADQNIFSFDDFNLVYQQEIKKHIEQAELPNDFRFALELKIYIRVVPF